MENNMMTVKDHLIGDGDYDHIKGMFFRIVNKMEEQGWQRSMKDHLCAYRGDDNLCCAVGALLDDENYNLLQSE